MLQFIAQYWLTTLFGLVAAGIGLLCRKFWKMYKDEKQKDVQQEINTLLEQYDQKDKELQAEIEKAHQDSLTHDEEIIKMFKDLTDYIETLKDGVLSIQGSHFRKRCYEYLKEDRVITLEEFTQLEKDHHVYNSLGGNHRGDELFGLVKIKVEKQYAK